MFLWKTKTDFKFLDSGTTKQSLKEVVLTSKFDSPTFLYGNKEKKLSLHASTNDRYPNSLGKSTFVEKDLMYSVFSESAIGNR